MGTPLVRNSYLPYLDTHSAVSTPCGILQSTACVALGRMGGDGGSTRGKCPSCFLQQPASSLRYILSCNRAEDSQGQAGLSCGQQLSLQGALSWAKHTGRQAQTILMYPSAAPAARHCLDKMMIWQSLLAANRFLKLLHDCRFYQMCHAVEGISGSCMDQQVQAIIIKMI